MSLKAKLIRFAIKVTPKFMVLWIANMKLRGVAQLTDFAFDLDARTVYVRTLLAGEQAPLEVWVEDFSVVQQGGSYKLLLKKADSNRPWLNNIFGRIVGKLWPIPSIPQLAPYMGLVCELLGARTPVGDGSARLPPR